MRQQAADGRPATILLKHNIIIIALNRIFFSLNRYTLFGSIMKTLIIILTIFLISSLTAEAHGGDDHKTKATANQSGDYESESSESAEQESNHAAESATANSKSRGSDKISQEGNESIMAGLDEFPTLHPLIVHFPIVLLIVAFFTQLFGFFVYKDALNMLTLVFMIIGTIGAIAAANFFHPHTDGLTAAAQKVLELHETYAEYTVLASVIGTLLKAVSLLFFKRKFIVELIAALFIFMSVISVSVTGHYGAQLIHIEGVGAHGNFLETHGHD